MKKMTLSISLLIALLLIGISGAMADRVFTYLETPINLTDFLSASNVGNIDGTYKTDFGEMTLTINGNHVTGKYKYKDGKIDGTLNGNKLTGTWTQTNARGRMEFLFNSDFSAFTGKWNYNSAAPSSKWNGTKIGAATATKNVPLVVPKKMEIEGTYKTDFSDMSLVANGNHITGKYNYKGGKINGTLNGNRLTGTWTQTNSKGTFVFVFNKDFTSFSGKWGYNSDTPTGKWNGVRIGK